MSWVLHRVDDRLIHGQVVIAWGQRLAPQPHLGRRRRRRGQRLGDATCSSSAAPGIDVHVVVGGSDRAATTRVRSRPTGGAFLLVRDLATALALVEAGARVPGFNLGGLHYAPGKDQGERVHLSRRRRPSRGARALLEHGLTLDVQDVPASRPHSLAALDPESALR